jgi:hypothetical protein
LRECSAELGHGYSAGARESLQASVTTSGALVFWPDFFEIWTHARFLTRLLSRRDPGHFGSELRELQQSPIPLALDQVTATGAISVFVDLPDSASGPGGYSDNRADIIAQVGFCSL